MIPDELRTLKGFNVEEGLFRLCDNSDLYMELIRDFSREYGHAADEFQRLMTFPDREPVRRLIHTIKGISGNLAIAGLHSASTELESAVKENLQEAIPPLFETFRDRLEETMAAIEDSGINRIGEGRNEPGKTLDRDAVMPLLDSFIRHSGNRLARQSAEVLRDLSDYEWPEEGRLLLEEMAQLTGSYKLKEAAYQAECLRQLMADEGKTDGSDH